MSFNKAVVKRFNEEQSCAPPSTKYYPNMDRDVKGIPFQCYSGRDTDAKIVKEGEFAIPSITPTRSRKVYKSTPSTSKSSSRSASVESTPRSRSNSVTGKATPLGQELSGSNEAISHYGSTQSLHNALQQDYEALEAKYIEVVEEQTRCMEHIQLLESELHSIKAELKDKSNQMDLEHQKIIDMKVVLSEKEEMLASLTQQSQDSEAISAQKDAELLKISKRVAELESELNINKSELETAALDQVQLESTLKEKYELIRIISEEKDLLQTTLVDKNEEINQLKFHIEHSDSEREQVLGQIEINKVEYQLSLSEKQEIITSLSTSLSQQAEDSKDRVGALESELDQCTAELNHNQVELDVTKQNLAKFEEFSNLLQSEMHNLKAELSDKSNQMDSELQKIIDMKVVLSEKEEMLASLTQQSQDSKAISAQKDAELLEISKRVADLESKLSSKESELETAALTQVKLESTLKEISEEKDLLQTTLVDKNEEINQLKFRIEHSDSEREQVLDQIEINKVEYQLSLSEKQEIITSLSTSLSQQAEDSKDRVGALESELDQCTAELTHNKVELNVTKQNLAKFEEFSNLLQSEMHNLKAELSDKSNQIELELQKNIDVKVLLSEKEEEIAALSASLTLQVEDTKAISTRKDEELAEISERVGSLESELDVTKQNLAKSEEFSNLLQSQLNDKSKQMDLEHQKIVDMKVLLSEKEEEITALSASLFQQAQDFKAISANKDAELVEISKRVADLESELSSNESELETAALTQVQLKSTLKEISEEKDLLQTVVVDKNEEINQLKLQIKHSDSERDQVLDQMEICQVEYQLSLSEKEETIASLSASLTLQIEDTKAISARKDEELAEISARVRSLESELDVTKQNLAKSEEFSNLLQSELQSIKAELNDKSNQMELEFQKSSDMKVLLSEKEGEVAALSASLTQQVEDTKAISARKDEELAEISERVMSLESKLDVTKQNLAKFEEFSNLLQSEMHNLKAELSDKSNQIELELQKNIDMKVLLSEKEEDIAALSVSLTQQVEDFKTIFTQKDEELAEISERVGGLESELDQCKAELKRNNVELDMTKQNLTKFEEFSNIREQYARLLAEKNALSLKYTELNEKYAKLMGHGNHRQKILHVVKLKEEKETLKKETDELRTKLSKRESEINELKRCLKANPGAKRFDRSEAFKLKEPLKEPYIPESGDIRGHDSRQTFVIPKKPVQKPVATARIRAESRRETGQGMAFEIEFDDKENGN